MCLRLPSFSYLHAVDLSISGGEKDNGKLKRSQQIPCSIFQKCFISALCLDFSLERNVQCVQTSLGLPNIAIMSLRSSSMYHEGAGGRNKLRCTHMLTSTSFGRIRCVL